MSRPELDTVVLTGFAMLVVLGIWAFAFRTVGPVPPLIAIGMLYLLSMWRLLRTRRRRAR